MPLSSVSPHSADEGRKLNKRKGRPKAWTAPLIREMLALDIFTNLNNDQLLQSLRGSNEGTRSLQVQRKQLLGAGHRRWRSRDASQMHKRISHLHSQFKPGTGPRVFSLDHPETRPRHRFEIDTPPHEDDAKFLPSTDCANLTFQLVRGTQLETDQKVRIRVSMLNKEGSTCYSRIPEVNSTLDRIHHSTTSSPGATHQLSWSAVLSHINLRLYPVLEGRRPFGVLQDRIVKLALNNCRLRTVPRVIRSLPNLRYLNLQRNRLTTISAEQLPETLTCLDLRHNQITSLSADLLNLSSLRVLELSHNAIRELPPWLAHWKSLQVLFVNGNPLGTQSYSHYHRAFQNCRVGTKFESCTDCLVFATKSLKHQLDPTFQHAIGTNRLRGCKCNFMTDIGTALSDLDNHGEDERLENHSSKAFDTSNDVASLKTFLDRMSFLSDSMRSSVSAFTLKSLSSIGDRETVSRFDTQALMLVHCCFREIDDTRPACMHFRIATWVSSGQKDDFPWTALCELDHEGNSALHIAAAFGATPEALRAFVDQGCAPTIINNDGETFLHRVATGYWNPQDEEVRDLIRHLYTVGFRFEHRDNHGNTIFHKSDQLRMALAHIPSLPDYVSKCRFKKNAAGIMLSDGMRHVLRSPPARFECCSHPPRVTSTATRLTFNSPPLAVTRIKGTFTKTNICSAECLATHSDPLHALARLISLGHQNFIADGRTELWDCQAALKGILDAGADVNDYNNEGITTLMAFIRSLSRRQRQLGDTQVESCVRLLVQYGADARSISRSGDTVLHHAIYYGLPLAIEPLIDAGANVNARNRKGLSVMQLLMETMHKMKSNLDLFAAFQQCMVVLVDHGADAHPTLEQELQWLDSGRMYSPMTPMYLSPKLLNDRVVAT